MPRTWLARWLFRLTCGLAGLLVLAVVGAPWVEGWLGNTAGWGRVLRLFAEDVAVRRTSLASALGLVVTAFVFFRPPAGRARQ
jgi:hypothetical protein